MTTCASIQPRLTAYLDGELTGDDGSLVRGHLRECAACRLLARDEAALRDGLRQLAPVDPPASLWAGVQAKLAAAEVADARTPRWRRSLVRWARWMPWPLTRPQYVAGGLLAACAAVMLYWRTAPAPDTVATVPVLAPMPAPIPAPPQPAHPSVALSEAPSLGDVTADLQAEPARTTETYGQAIEELMTLAGEARTRWSTEQKSAFDARLAVLRDGFNRAAVGHPQQRAQREMIRYLQGAIVRDDVLLANGGGR